MNDTCNSETQIEGKKSEDPFSHLEHIGNVSSIKKGRERLLDQTIGLVENDPMAYLRCHSI